MKHQKLLRQAAAEELGEAAGLEDEDVNKLTSMYEAAPEMEQALHKIELWSRDHPNGTCEAINDKARAVLAKLQED